MGIIVKTLKTKFPEVLILQPNTYTDKRGYFLESFNKKVYKELGIFDEFVQDNISYSVKNTIRGLHYQVGKKSQGKLCQVIRGQILDVVVDIRPTSLTFGKHISIILDSNNKYQLWIPPGFAHGFSVLSDDVIFSYKCTNYYNKSDERSIAFNDPDINIGWMVKNPIVSEKDLNAPKFREIKWQE